MRKLLLFTAFAIAQSSLNAQKTIDIDAKIKSVTVYLNGAHITRKTEAVVGQGVTKLRFTNLSSTIDPNSVQVEGKGAVTLLSVNHQLNYLNETGKSKHIVELEDSLESIQLKLDVNASLSEVYEEEKALILANKDVKSEEKGLFAEDLEDVADFYRKRLPEVQLHILEVKRTAKTLNEKKVRFQKQLSDLNSRRAKPTSEVIVEVKANTKTKTGLTLSYLVRGASWNPVYDIRAKDTQSPVTMEYKANVQQNTGIDWKNVALTLSTGNPALSGTKPELTPWRLYLKNPEDKRKRYESNRYLSNRAMPMAAGVQLDEVVEYKKEVEIETSANYTQVQQNQLNVSFAIEIPYSIPSDNKKHLVNIRNLELPATYTYYAAPKMDPTAFLLARVSGWSEYNILPGQANIYLEGAYVGKSYINTEITKDTLDLSLGRDKGVVIKRERIKEFTVRKVIGSSKKETLGLQVSIKNTKPFPIAIVIEDQIPVSSNKEIEVELLESTNAKHTQNTGYLQWKLNLTPGQGKNVVFKYSVKYPKNKLVNL